MTESGPSGRRKGDGARTAKIPIRVKNFSSWTALTTLLFGVGFLIAGGLLYYSYVKNHEASLTKRHFRNLETPKASDLGDIIVEHFLFIEDDDAAGSMPQRGFHALIDVSGEIVKAEQVWDAGVEDRMLFASRRCGEPGLVDRNILHLMATAIEQVEERER